jgi:chromosome partitioning protein
MEDSGMIVALTNSKGGVGKSTLAVHLAAWWKESGANVALVDADVQGSSSLWLKETGTEIPVFRLQSADEVLDRVPEISRTFQHIVVDGPAGLSEVTRAILLVADLALLPCGPSVLDLRAANDAIRVVKQAQAIRSGRPDAVLIPNKLQAHYRLSRELLETTRNMAVASTTGLRLRQAYAEAAGQGTVVWRLGPRGEMATSEIRELWNGLFRTDTENDGRSIADGGAQPGGTDLCERR